MGHETTLARGRAFLERAMVDTCLIERENLSARFTDIHTGVVTKTYITVYSGRCELKQAGGNASIPGSGSSASGIGESSMRTGSGELKLPVVGSEEIFPDDRVTITACLNDTEVVGRQYWVTGQSHASHKTTRRLSISELEPQ